jgi:small-conductance mechanosensitive channel
MQIMKQSFRTRILVVLASGLLAATAHSQEAEKAPPPIPDLAALQGSGWSYFEGTRAEVEPRVAEFLDKAEAQLSELSAQNEEVASALLQALRDNLSAYVALLEEPAMVPQELEPAPMTYDIDALLELAHEARRARADAQEEQLAVERESRILSGATRRRDMAFGVYVDADAGDARWLAGLQLMQAKSAQAISGRRLTILTRRYEQANAYADAVADRVEIAKSRLAATVDEDSLAEMIEQIAVKRAAVNEAAERLRAAELAASGLEIDTAQGRSQQRLVQQRMLTAEVDLAAAEVELTQMQARRWWVELQLDTGMDLDRLSSKILGWQESVRNTASRIPEWRRITEDELLAVQGMNRESFDRASLRLLDQRLGMAQETLTKISDLQTANADLELIISAVEIIAADRTGAIGSLVSTIKIGLRTAFIRATGWADVTLFSIGEAPVTGGDIVRVLLIILAGLLLSRGIRHAISRFGQGESSGTQASLYTVGRLSHYVIIIFAVFIALSSVGIDFGNLALVAGALSVGIGFGLQSIVNNFVSGLIILFEHSLRVGDYIELDTGLTGTVKSINVRSTLINTNDNIDIVVPNSEFVTARLQNWTLGERVLRVRIPFGVAYGSDKELVKKAALEAANEVPYTLTHMKGREPDAWLTEFGDNSLNFLLLVWVNRQGARRPTRTRSAYLWALETKLTEYGIEIPFPQRDLHLRSGWLQEPPGATGENRADDEADEPGEPAAAR